MNTKEYVDKLFLGFLGTCYYEGIYEGQSYMAEIETYHTMVLLSRTPITSDSNPYRNGYETKVALSALDNLMRCKMYATYKGNEYEVLDVAPELKAMHLSARKNKYDSILAEDKELGFTYDRCMNMSSKKVTPDEIESIRIEKTSIKSRLMKKNGLWNRLKDLQKEIDNARKNEVARKKQYLDNLYKTVNDVILNVEMRDFPPSNGSDAGIRKAVAELEDLPNYPALYAAASEVDSFYSEECKSWD